MNYEVVIRGERVLTTAGFQPREVAIEAGKIVAMEPLGNGLEAETVIDLAPDEVLLPGLVDTHVHINEPGRTEWEGFDSATRAAAKGGVTTVIDMPLNSIPPTINVSALEEKVAATEGKRHVNVGFWGGAVPGNKDDLRSLHDAGVFGFKCFLLHSGVDEFQPLDPDALEEYLREVANYDATMIVHAEDSVRSIAPPLRGRPVRPVLNSRPRSAENLAIAEVIVPAPAGPGQGPHLHLSSSDALPMIASAKRRGEDHRGDLPALPQPVGEEIPAGNTAFKVLPRSGRPRTGTCCGGPPRRHDRLHRHDHSPSIDLKNLDSGDFGTAWEGSPSLQVSLPVVWTAARARGIELEKVVEWMASKPAELAGLRSKGTIGVGFDADLSIFAPDEAFVVHAENLEHKNAITPYDERALSGVVRRVFLAGSDIDFDHPAGELIWRGLT